MRCPASGRQVNDLSLLPDAGHLKLILNYLSTSTLHKSTADHPKQGVNPNGMSILAHRVHEATARDSAASKPRAE